MASSILSTNPMFAMRNSVSASRRWVVALLSAFVLLICAASAQAATYTYTIPSQTWGRPNVGAGCSGSTTTTYATLAISLYGSATITATRASGSGISLTTYQNSVFSTQPCVNYWDATQGGTTSVSRTLSYAPGPPFNFASTFYIVVSGNSASDLANITVTATLNSGTTLNLICGAGTFSPATVSPTSAGGTFSSTYTPPVGEIGCNAWSASTPVAWINNISPTSGTAAQSITFNVDANGTASARNSKINIGTASVSSLNVNQAAGSSCSYSLTPTSASVGAAASSGSFAINTTSSCAWTATTAAAYVTGVTASGTGTGTVNYNVGANTGPARTATITAGGKAYTIDQASGCTYALSATSASPSAAGGTASVTVTPSNASCVWTASSNSAFLTGVTASGTGTGSVSYTVGANTSVARSGTLTIAGQTFTVNQASGCTFTVSPTSISSSAAAGSGTLTITASNAACPWTAANNDSWLAVSPTSGTGSGTTTYNVGVNVGPARNGALTVAGQPVPVTQSSGCTASLSAGSASIGGSGGAGSVTLTMSSAACAWSASSSATWVTLPSSGTGSATINFTVASQTGPARTATLVIAGQTFTVNQGNACTYTISPTSASPGAGAGTGNLTVTPSDSACTWTVASNASWLASTSSGGTGTQSVPYDFQANVGLARSGTFTIAGQTFSVNQANGCAASLSPSSISASAAGTTSSFTITMSAPACTWTASSPSSFVTGVTASGTGTASVAFTLAANSGPARSGSIVAGGSTFTISQASGCTASLGSSSANATASGGPSSVALTMSASTCPWTATSSASWLSVTASGTGSGSVAYTAAANTAGPRTGTLTIAGQTFTVNQPDGCSFTLSATQAAAAATGGSGSISVTASASTCAFTTSSQASWLTGVTAGTNGSATINYAVAANPGSARSGTLTIAGQTVTINQATGCVATLSTQAVPANASGGSTTINVTMSGPSCDWTATTSAPFITNVGAGSTGSGSVTFTVSPNVGVARSGTLIIAGTTVTVSQASGCTFLINPTGAELGPQAASPLTFTLSASDPACPWTMQGHDSWVTLNTPSGTGSATLSYAAAANVGPARTSSIDVGGRTFGILQDDGCQASVTPTGTIELSAAAQTTQFHLALSANTCAWTASSSNSWLSVTDSAGTGSGDVHLDVQANTGPARTLQVQLKGGQTVAVHQASGCAVSLPSPTASAFATGGSATFNVDTANGCAFTAESSAPWISNVVVTAQGTSYDVTPSAETSRVGSITVRSTSTTSSAVYTVTQSSGCVAVLSAGGSSAGADGGPATFTVQTHSSCQFSVATTDSWLQPITVDGSTVSFQAAGNLGPARTGTIAVTSTETAVTTNYAVSQASGCTLAIASQELALGKSGGTGSFAVTTGEGCGVNVSSPDAWLSGFTYSQGLVGFAAGANANASRAGTIVVKAADSDASMTFTVHETSGCALTLPVVSAEVGLTGANVSFDVKTGTDCHFTMVSDASWVQNLAETESGVTFSTEDNTGVARTTTITLTTTDTSETATYVVHQAGAITAPVIGTQPAGQQIHSGDALRLDVVASGGDLHYQWRKNGIEIPGATALEYLLLSATLDDAGSYDVVISNAAGSVTSSVALVVVSDKEPTGGGSDGGAGGAPDATDAGAANGGSGSAGAPDDQGGTSGMPGTPGTGGNAESPPYVGGSGCTCSLIGPRHRNLAGGALALLVTATLIARRRRSSKPGRVE